MKDHEKTREELVEELTKTQCRLASLEAATAAQGSCQPSDDRYRQLMEAIPQTIWRAEASGELGEVSNHWCQYTGQTSEEARGSGWIKALHPDDVERVLDCMRASTARGDVYQVEYRLRRADGSYGWHLAWGRPKKDNDGKILGWFGSVTDIDVHKRAEEELSENRAILRATIDCLPFDFFAIGMDGRYIMQNAASKAHWGDAIGKRPEDMTDSKEDLALWKENNRRAFAGESVDQEVTLTRNGEKCHYRNVIAPIVESGQIEGILGLNVDITARKRAEKALRKAHDQLEQKVHERTAELIKANDDLALFRMFAEASGQGVGMGGLDGSITYVNPSLCRLCGEAKPEDMIGKSFRTYYPEEWVERREKEIIPTMERQGYWAGEQAVLSRQGKLIPTWHDVFFVRDQTGKPVRRCAIITDITQRKQAEEALRREHRTLKHLLESSDHERQLIAYEIHDGLAQQLAGAIMQFQTFSHLKETKPKAAEKSFEAGVTMLQQGHFEARRLISGVRPPILDEEGVVAAVAHLVNEHSRRKGPKIEYRSRVDFDRLAPILENAIYRTVQEGLHNACQHSRSETVRVSLVQQEETVRIEIRDWGIGFSPKETKDGCYGLVGMRQRARLLGGRCSIRSKAGRGTRVTAELPVVVRE